MKTARAERRLLPCAFLRRWALRAERNRIMQLVGTLRRLLRIQASIERSAR